MEKQFLNINYRKRKAKAQVQVFSFDDHGHTVHYIPAFNLSSYGRDESEAREMMKETFDSFFNSLFDLKKSQVDAELRKLGWSAEQFRSKRLSNISHTTFEDIKREFDISEESEIKEQKSFEMAL